MSVEPVTVLRGHHGDVQTLAFWTKQLLFSGGIDGDVKLWDLEERRPLFTRRLHEANAGVIKVACLPSQQRVLSQGRDGCIKVWATHDAGHLSEQPLTAIHTGSYNFCQLAVLRVDHPQVFPAGAAASSSPSQTSSPGPPAVQSNQLIAPKGTAPIPPAASGHIHGHCYLACPAEDAADIGVWSVESGQQVMRLGHPESEPGVKHGMCMSLQLFNAPSNSTNAATAPSSDTLSHETATAQPAVTNNASAGAGGAATSAPYAVAGYEDGVVGVWDMRRADQPLALQRMHEEPVMALSLAPGAHEGVSGSAGDKVSCFTLQPSAPASAVLALKKQLALPVPGVSDVCIRADGKIFAVAGWDCKVRVYGVRKKEPLAVLRYHRGQATCVRFSPDLSLLASASRDSTIALWSIYPP